MNILYYDLLHFAEFGLNTQFYITVISVQKMHNQGIIDKLKMRFYHNFTFDYDMIDINNQSMLFHHRQISSQFFISEII